MAKPAYRPDIQGLRAVAVLAVMLFHYDATLLPGGYVGVDIFLVISGYLITQQLHSRKHGSQYSLVGCVSGFYVSRIKRIVPAYFFMLGIVAVLSKLLFTNTDFAYFVASLKTTALFVSNGYFAGFGDYFAPGLTEQPLLHTWSLAVEMQFYFLLPLLILIVPDRQIKHSVLVLAIVLTVIAEWQLRVVGDHQQTYYALYSRIPEFLVGSWLALRATGQHWSTTQANLAFGSGATLIAISFFVLDGASSFPGLLALPPVLGAGLIIAARASSFCAVLRNPVMVGLGFLSYSLYLWHWPVLALIRYYTGAASLGSKATVLFLLATLLLACLSFYLVEEPARKFRLSIITRRRAVAGVLIASAGPLAAYQAGAAAKSYLSSSGLPVEYTRYADPATICHGVDNGHCVKGSLDSPRDILVIGDSHAAMLNRLFDRLGKEQGFKATVLTASSCVPISGFNIAKLPEWAQQSCLDQIRRVESLIEKSRTIFIAGMWSYQTQDPSFAPTLKRFIETVGAGRRLYVLSQVPELAKNPMRMHRFTGLGLAHHASLDPGYQQANEIIGNAARQSGGKFVILDQLDVFRNAPYLGSELIYMDESHLNEVGVDAYAEAAGPQIYKLATTDGQ